MFNILLKVAHMWSRFLFFVLNGERWFIWLRNCKGSCYKGEVINAMLPPPFRSLPCACWHPCCLTALMTSRKDRHCWTASSPFLATPSSPVPTTRPSQLLVRTYWFLCHLYPSIERIFETTNIWNILGEGFFHANWKLAKGDKTCKKKKKVPTWYSVRTTVGFLKGIPC